MRNLVRTLATFIACLVIAGTGLAQGVYSTYATRITQRYDLAKREGPVSAPAPVAVPYPLYPVEMSRAGLGGKASVQFRVTSAGEVADVKLVAAAFPEFGEAALRAVKTWRFRSLTEHGPGYPANVLVIAAFEFEIVDG